MLGLFRRSKKEDEPKMEEKQTASTSDPNPQPQTQETIQATAIETGMKQEAHAKAYLKAMPLHDLADIENVELEIKAGNIIILKITPLANKSIQDVSKAVNELYAFTESIGGDIARLGEERIVVCPPQIRIWREKKPARDEPLPTAA